MGELGAFRPGGGANDELAFVHNGHISVRKVRDGQILWEAPKTDDNLVYLKYSPDGSTLVSVVENGKGDSSIVSYSANTGAPNASVKIDGSWTTDAEHISMSGDGHYLAIAAKGLGWKRRLLVFDLHARKVAWMKEFAKYPRAEATNVSFGGSNDHFVLLHDGESGMAIEVYSALEAQLVQTLNYTGIDRAIISNTGKMMIGPKNTGALDIWKHK